MPYPREPTTEEWLSLKKEFSNLIKADVMVTDGETIDYNCIAWALGYTDRWINPPNPIASFNLVFLGYSQRGYTQQLPALDSSATCDGFGQSDDNMTHASRNDPRNDIPPWSSKLGRDLRITHNRLGLNGDLYGEILVSYK
jgi:hypothetical protein